MSLPDKTDRNYFFKNREDYTVEDFFDKLGVGIAKENRNFIYEKLYKDQSDEINKINILEYINKKYIYSEYENREEFVKKLDFIVETLETTIAKNELAISTVATYTKKEKQTITWKLNKIEELKEFLKLESARLRPLIYQIELMKESMREFTTSIEQKSERIEKRSNNISAKLNKIDQKSKSIESKLQESKENIYKEILTILGLFTTILFGSFGGVSVLNSFFGGITEPGIRLRQLIILGSISAIVIITLVYMIFTYISKLTNLNIDEKEGKFKQNHPIIYYSYCFFGMILFTGVILYLIDFNSIFPFKIKK